MLVDLVGDHPDAMGQRPLADGLDLGGGVHGAGRVRRRDEDEQLGARRARSLKLGDGGPVAAGLIGHDLDRDTAGQADRLRVGGPVRSGQDRLVLGIEQGGKGVVEGLLASVCYQHLGCGDGIAAVAQGLGRDGLLQRRQAPRRGVAVHGRYPAGSDGGVDDVVRGRKVRLAGSEADDGATGGLEGLRLGVDGQGGRLGN